MKTWWQLHPSPSTDESQQTNRYPFIGSWRITSAWLGDTDLLAGGLSLVQTFRSDLSYSWFLSNDFDHLACTSPIPTAHGTARTSIHPLP